MRNDHHATRFELELEMIERRPALGDRAALQLLRNEFHLALNAAQFSALAVGDVAVQIGARHTPQEGIACYEVALELIEHSAELGDEPAIALLRNEFRRAQNSSYFQRICVEDIRVTVLARTWIEPRVALRAGV